MADEIIKLWEYFAGDPTIQNVALGAVIAYGLFTLLIIAGCVTVFVIVIKNIIKFNREFDDEWKGHTR